MRTKNMTEVMYVTILFILSVCIGIYLVLTTVVISKDGTTFIEYAKNLETEPAKTIIQQAQHPGYPAMILLVHKAVRLFSKSDSIFIWIYSAQFITLLFRIFTIVIMYFIGKTLAGAKFGFLAILIFIFLPNPAKYGSDALSDWPHLFFLSSGILLLLHSSKKQNNWIFGGLGICAGLGYLVRPECSQLVIYGVLLILLTAISSKKQINRTQTIPALIELLLFFAIIAGPYMLYKKAVFPKKDTGPLSSVIAPVSENTYTVGVKSFNVIEPIEKLFKNIGETLMWFFVPGWLAGLYLFIKEKPWYESKKIIIASFISLNVILMAWLYHFAGYMSQRHSLPLIALTIFFIPAGLLILCSFVGKILNKENRELNSDFLLNLLIIIGIAICIPKLLNPLHNDSKIIRQAAVWISHNTKQEDVIAVPDLRISFYAGRKGEDYKHFKMESAQYAVVIKGEKGQSAEIKLPENAKEMYNKSDDNDGFIIYKLSD